MACVIKVELTEPIGKPLRFVAQKTMYGGKHIAAGDTLYVFSSENGGGCGLVARAIVTEAIAVAKRPDLARQTPRVTVAAEPQALAIRPLGRAGLKTFDTWDDGRPETELNFKLYRQATDKIVGISPEAAAFLETFF